MRYLIYLMLLTATSLNAASIHKWTDDEGNVWDVFGTAVSGPRAGDQLNLTTSFTPYWFAWSAFHPDSTVFIASQ